MADNDRRERHRERRLARQRGAGTREIKNADFGFTIGAAPLEAKKSTGRRSKTPQALPARPSTRKTPKPTPAQDAASAKATTTRTRRSASAPKTGTGKAAGKKAAQEQYKTPTVTGKRKRAAGKTAQEQEEDELEADDEQHRHTAKRTFVTPATRQSPAAQGASVEPLARTAEGNDELEDADADHTIASTGANARASSIILPSASKSASKHVANDPTTTTPAAHASQPGQITTPFIDPLLLAARKSTAKGKSKVKKSTSKASADQENLGPRSTPGAIVSLKPRTPLVPVANMFPVSGGPSTLRSPTRIVNDISPLFQPGEEADAEGSPARSFDENDDNAQGETDGEDELTPAPTTAPRKTKAHSKNARATPKKASKLKGGARPKAKTTKTKAKAAARRSHSPESSLPAKSSAITVPIAIYRPTNTPTLYSTQAPDADPLGSEPVPSLNPVDVLAQIAGEIVRSFVESYDADGSSNVWAGDGVRKRQKRAVARFGGVLQDALFALTAAVGAGRALAKRVGAVRRRRRGALRDELAALRAEREAVGREMDAVRAEYARKKESFEGDLELAALAGRIKEQVRERRERVGRGESVEEEQPLELLVDDVTPLVGSETGLLSQVKSLNEKMERMAEEIEQSG